MLYTNRYRNGALGAIWFAAAVIVMMRAGLQYTTFGSSASSHKGSSYRGSHSGQRNRMSPAETRHRLNAMTVTQELPGQSCSSPGVINPIGILMAIATALAGFLYVMVMTQATIIGSFTVAISVGLLSLLRGPKVRSEPEVAESTPRQTHANVVGLNKERSHGQSFASNIESTTAPKLVAQADASRSSALPSSRNSSKAATYEDLAKQYSRSDFAANFAKTSLAAPTSLSEAWASAHEGPGELASPPGMRSRGADASASRRSTSNRRKNSTAAGIMLGRTTQEASDEKFRATGEAVGSNVFGIAGGGAGLAFGGAAGGLLGLAAAPFTMGMSIPAGVAAGAAAGVTGGVAAGGTAGAVVGKAASYQVQKIMKSDEESSDLEGATDSRPFVLGEIPPGAVSSGARAAWV